MTTDLFTSLSLLASLAALALGVSAHIRLTNLVARLALRSRLFRDGGK